MKNNGLTKYLVKKVFHWERFSRFSLNESVINEVLKEKYMRKWWKKEELPTTTPFATIWITWSGVYRSSIRFKILTTGMLSIVFSTPRVTLVIICLDVLSIICNTLYNNKIENKEQYLQRSKFIGGTIVIVKYEI